MSGKITASHLQRQAFVYVRQSTSAQVYEHVESRQRQYALAKRALALGWASGAVEIVDEDQGKSGASTVGRDGFAKLAHAVSEGRVGAVFAVEVSRLARSSQDWQRLLSLCAVAGVVVVDEQTVYDPGHHDDKLLLDLKGAMSEQELHWLSLRLAGGRLNKARRGESYVTPPVGYVWGERGLELDPDESVRSAVRVVFERFAVEPSARAVLRWACASKFLMPTRQRGTSEIRYGSLGNLRLRNMLHNPIYAGVYVYGRHPTKKVLVGGEIRKVRKRLDEPSEWPVRIHEAHPAYLSWDAYMKNREKLRLNTNRAERAGRGAPREGQALLAGLVLCGRCGRRMGVRYESRSPRLHYTCYGESGKGVRLCWSVSGRLIDRAVEKLFLETMVPGELELSLAVEREVIEQADSLEKAWRARVEQAQYEARRAERRYKAVDPDNRVVARTLEREWEQRLQELAAVEQQRAEARRQHRVELGPEDRKRIRELAHDLPAVWAAPTTNMADRKAMLRLVIEAIALHPLDMPERGTLVRVQWMSGVVNEIKVDRPARGAYHKHAPATQQRIRQLAAIGYRDDQIGQTLNVEGSTTGTGLAWNEERVRAARRAMGAARIAAHRPRKEALPDRLADGRYSVPGLMARLGVAKSVVHAWIRGSVLNASRADHGSHRRVYWIDVDEAKIQQLKRRHLRWVRRRRH